MRSVILCVVELRVHGDISYFDKITRWKSRTRGLGGDSHIDVSVLFFKPSSEQVIELLNSFLQFVKQILLNYAQLVVLIVSRLY